MKGIKGISKTKSVPVVPGCAPFQSFQSFQRFQSFQKPALRLLCWMSPVAPASLHEDGTMADISAIVPRRQVRWRAGISNSSVLRGWRASYKTAALFGLLSANSPAGRNEFFHTGLFATTSQPALIGAPGVPLAFTGMYSVSILAKCKLN